MNGDTMNDAKDKAESVISKTSQMGKEAVNEASDKARRFAQEVHDGVDGALSSVGSKARDAADTIRSNSPSSLAPVSDKVASAIDKSGKYLEDKGVSGIAGDASSLIRRYPLASIAIGFGAGLFLARKMTRQ